MFVSPSHHNSELIWVIPDSFNPEKSMGSTRCVNKTSLRLKNTIVYVILLICLTIIITSRTHEVVLINNLGQ